MSAYAVLASGVVALGLAAGSAFAPSPAVAADSVLAGTIRDNAGKAMGGVTVSAKPAGGVITTSVFTDQEGRYYFPPMAEGNYKVWAQALTFATAKGAANLSGTTRQDFTLSPLADFAAQLPGDIMLSALPDKTPDDARMKTLVRNNCTGCHTPSYVLQHKFDAHGWSAIIDLMKRVNNAAIVQPKRPLNPVLDREQKDLAAYLARARGPDATSMDFSQMRPRPSGEAARIVVREYDVPVEAEFGPNKAETNDGSDWAMGTPSRKGSIIHDAWADLDGNLWFTSNTQNHNVTVARVDGKTGAYKPFKIAARNGFAAGAHGMTRDPQGIFWFNANTGRGSLARLDPKTQEIEIFVPPTGMTPTGGATTVDYDGKGMIWVTSDTGALRFDPQTRTFTEFKSPTQHDASGTFGRTYGIAADRDGNGWWAQMMTDTISKGDPQTGKATEIRLPHVKANEDRLSTDARAYYEKAVQPDFNTPVPWSQGPRRMGTDKNGDVLWVGNSWGANLARIDTKTGATTILPAPYGMQPYQITVDSDHNAWTNLWTTDSLLRFNPASKTWTVFDLPTRGTEARYISMTERDGRREIVVPYSRTSKIAVVRERSQQEIDALKAQVK